MQGAAMKERHVMTADRRALMWKTIAVGYWGLLAVTLHTRAALAQFSSGSTGADGPLVFYAPPPISYSTSDVGMAFDSDRQVTVLFDNATGVVSEWDGIKWLVRTLPNSPPAPRLGAAMAYDSDRHVTVLFGGQEALSSEARSDTWEYNGVSWIQRNPMTSPAARYGHAMVFDATRHRTLLTGGLDPSTGLNTADTWLWDGTTWALEQPATQLPNLVYHAMAYDAQRAVVVLPYLDGGYGGVFRTFEWNGTDWIEQHPAHVPSGPPVSFALAYDSARHRTVLFGGATPVSCGPYSCGGNTPLDNTWLWDGIDWSMAATGPARSYGHMVFDSQRGVAVLFGGIAPNYPNGIPRADTLLWDGAAWALAPLVGPDVTFDMSAKSNGVWNFTTIGVPAGVTVHFKKNAANTPVTWLATGDVNVGGEITLDGQASGADASGAPGGPGGYAGGEGGRAFSASGSYSGMGGEGPGGGPPGGSASYGTASDCPKAGATYGNRRLQPLVGGSGGGGGNSTDDADGSGGSGGGGAILIASSSAIHLTGSIHANGATNSYGFAGSGGAIRLAANRIDGAGTLSVAGGYYPYAGGCTAGAGRIRLEGFFVSPQLGNYPTALPLALTEPKPGAIRITSVAGQAVPNPPNGDTNSPDVTFTSAGGQITIALATTNIPAGTTIHVRIAPAATDVILVDSSPTNASGTATANATVPPGVGTIQASADFVPAP